MERKDSTFIYKQPVLDDVACITIIQEFLLYKKLRKTCEMLREECAETGVPCPAGDQQLETSMTKEDAQTLITALKSENFNTFFKTWDVKIPAALRAADPEARRLIFLCHVATAARSGAEGMERLKSYFLTHNDQSLSRDPEILHYYALPFVADPQHHPAFQHLYKDGWWSEVKSSVEIFVRQITIRDSGPCLPLIRFGDCAATSNYGNPSQLRRKYKQLQTDYHRLLGVAGELTSALELTASGEVIDLSTTLSNCTKIFPELFPSSQYRSTPESVLRRSIVGRSKLSAENVADLELDFRKVRAHLASPKNNKTRLLLMQALRWRISQSSPEERDASVAAIVRHDLLGLRGGFSLLDLLTSPDGETPHPLQQGVARLVNALASLRAGRDYLSTLPEDQVVGVASTCLTGKRPEVKLDDVTADMLLALLQKLSLRRCHRETMISAGLVEWLVPRLEQILDTLKKNPEGSTYALEYATALLMNLCLHSRAKQRCIPLSGRALQLLAAMLGSAPLQALPYVNGALYSLLCEPLINQQARHMGLDKLLQFYLKQSSGELSRQLEHILGLLKGPKGPPEVLEAHSEDEGEADIASSAETVEEEVDSTDPVKADSEMCGERLLRSQYRVLFSARGPQQSNVQSQHNLSLQQDSQPRLSTPLPTGVLRNQGKETEKDVSEERSIHDERILKSRNSLTPQESALPVPDLSSISLSNDPKTSLENIETIKQPDDGIEDTESITSSIKLSGFIESKLSAAQSDIISMSSEILKPSADIEELIMNKDTDVETKDTDFAGTIDSISSLSVSSAIPYNLNEDKDTEINEIDKVTDIEIEGSDIVNMDPEIGNIASLEDLEKAVSLSEKIPPDDSPESEQKTDGDPTKSIFTPKPLLARTPPPGSPATSRLQELSKSVVKIQNAITKLN